MKDFTLHNEEKVNELARNARIDWQMDKEEAWNELQEKMKARKNAPKTRTLTMKPIFMYAAAAVLVLLGITNFVSFYSKTVFSHAGQKTAVILPDGSSVTLNAESELNYKPLAWYFSRSLTLSGEAYFEVEKGSAFEVNTENGTTVVLGTRFNVLSRGENFEVTCFHGSVAVSDNSSDQRVVLTPGQQTILDAGKLVLLNKEVNEANGAAWLNDKFSFEEKDIQLVFQEIERSYGIQISIKEALNEKYTGNFDRDSNPRVVLDMICKPLNLTCRLVSENKYEIVKGE